MILLIDHYDSFVHNQARYLRELGATAHVVRHDALTVSEVRRMQPKVIVLSPGPCTPLETGHTPEIIRTFLPTIPMLGICLGHQTLAAATGGRVVRSAPCHGRTSQIWHDGQADFFGVEQGFAAARYHSLAVDDSSLSEEWIVTARTTQGTVMALRHRVYRAVGWQFHPESVLTQSGYQLLYNFLRWVGIPANKPPNRATPKLPHARSTDWKMPVSQSGMRVTF